MTYDCRGKNSSVYVKYRNVTPSPSTSENNLRLLELLLELLLVQHRQQREQRQHAQHDNTVPRPRVARRCQLVQCLASLYSDERGRCDSEEGADDERRHRHADYWTGHIDEPVRQQRCYPKEQHVVQ